MNVRFLAIMAVGLLMAAELPQEDAARKDLEQLQGTWQLVSAMQDGKPLTDDKVKQTTIVFNGAKFRFPGAAEQATSKEGTMKIDATKKPRQMDARSTQGEVMRGIYEVEGDRYRVCFAPPGKERPTEFASRPGSGSILQVWQRQKAQPPQAEVSGVVTLDGKPLAGGVISFAPAVGDGPTAGAVIKDGKYSLRVPVGDKKVSISSPKPVGKKKLYDKPDSPEVELFQELLPAKYNVDTKLRVEIVPGKVRLDFELQSK